MKKAAKRPSRILPRGAISFIANLRSEYDALQDLESQKEACERALVVLGAEVDFLESKLASMASELKKWAPKGTVNVTNQYVTYGHIDRYFDRLMRLELLSDIEKLNLFCEAPSQVTLSGLAKNVLDFGPCLPSKFLFDVLMQYLPAGILSSFIPKHALQPG